MLKALCSFAVLFVASTSILACGPAAPPRVTAAVARPGQPWPSGTPACAIVSIPERGGCDRAIPVFSDAEGSTPLAIINNPEKVDLTWRELPVLGSNGLAKVDVFTPALFSGWASLAGMTFTMTAEVAIRQKHLVVTAGTRVSVVGTSGDKVIVRVPTPFKAPDAMEVAVDCHMLQYGHTGQPAGRPSWDRAYVTARTSAPIELRESPDGPAIFSFEPGQDQVFRSVAQREGSIRIAGGPLPGKAALPASTLSFDGWANVGLFYQGKAPPREHTTDRCLPDRYHMCPGSLGQVLRDAALNHGTSAPGQRFATVKSGTSVHVHEQFGDLVNVTFLNDEIAPPNGIRFFMPREAIMTDCQDEHPNANPGPGGCAPCVRRTE